MGDPRPPEGMEFASPFDERLCAAGPPAVFALDPSGRLRVDPERTRELYLILGDAVPSPADMENQRLQHHLVVRDVATGVRMYILANHDALADALPRVTVTRHADFASAQAEAVQQWAVPAPDALDTGDEEP